MPRRNNVSSSGKHRLPYTRVYATAMERFGLTRLDLMRMSWPELTMMFDATYDEEDRKSVKSDVVDATPEMYDAWA